METIYDWLSLGIFAGLIVLFLHRSTKAAADDQDDSLLLYLVAGGGCAASNYFGNEGQELVAISLIGLTLAFIVYFLKPFGWTWKS